MSDPITVIEGDSRAVLKTMADCSIDSCVTDPPYALVSTLKRFGKANDRQMPKKNHQYQRLSRGFMGQQWDTGDTAFDPEFWKEVYRVLKPGAHVLAFSGTRTYHRMVCAIEDAGFEIRDQIGWAYGSGFPKSHDVSKGIDRRAGAVREVTATGAPVKRMIPGADQNNDGWEKTNGREYVPSESRPVTPEAERWEGWGTALKPAWEPIVVARKPLNGTVAENVLQYGTGALNIDGCRVDITEDLPNYSKHGSGKVGSGGIYEGGYAGTPTVIENAHSQSVRHNAAGRWPANIVHDGSDEVLAAFPDAPGQQQDVALNAPSARTGNVYGKMNRHAEKSADRRYTEEGSTDFAALPGMRRGDSGSAARFFYTAKADAEDRMGSKHPTVKPVDLMQWLVRLVTPKGGLVLDPFAGSGTTGIAAKIEGMRAVLIEREPTFAADIRTRLEHAAGTAMHSVGIKMRNKRKEPDGPLFAERCTITKDMFE